MEIENLKDVEEDINKNEKKMKDIFELTEEAKTIFVKNDIDMIQKSSRFDTLLLQISNDQISLQTYKINKFDTLSNHKLERLDAAKNTLAKLSNLIFESDRVQESIKSCIEVIENQIKKFNNNEFDKNDTHGLEISKVLPLYERGLADLQSYSSDVMKVQVSSLKLYKDVLSKLKSLKAMPEKDNGN